MKRQPIAFDDGYLSLDELATYAGLCVRTLRRYLDDPRHPLPHYHIGGRVLVKRSEYDEWAQPYHVAPADTDTVQAAAVAVLAGMGRK